MVGAGRAGGREAFGATVSFSVDVTTSAVVEFCRWGLVEVVPAGEDVGDVGRRAGGFLWGIIAFVLGSWKGWRR